MKTATHTEIRNTSRGPLTVTVEANTNGYKGLVTFDKSTSSIDGKGAWDQAPLGPDELEETAHAEAIEIADEYAEMIEAGTH